MVSIFSVGNFMNPRLIKFVVDLQTPQKEEKVEEINFKNNGGGKKIFNLAKLAKVTVPVYKD